jgi:hypothetical protein
VAPFMSTVSRAELIWPDYTYRPKRRKGELSKML